MKHLLKHLAIALAAFVSLLTVYGVLIEPRLILDERRYRTPLPALGQEWAGTEVALFSDLQVGMWWANTGMVERVVDRVVQADPDAVLLGGDFLYSADPGGAVQVSTVLELLAPLADAGTPMFAVLGTTTMRWGRPRSSPRCWRTAVSRCCSTRQPRCPPRVARTRSSSSTSWPGPGTPGSGRRRGGVGRRPGQRPAHRADA